MTPRLVDFALFAALVLAWAVVFWLVADVRGARAARAYLERPAGEALAELMRRPVSWRVFGWSSIAGGVVVVAVAARSLPRGDPSRGMAFVMGGLMIGRGLAALHRRRPRRRGRVRA